MAFTAKILSWHFRHLNIVGCLFKRRPTKGGSRARPSYGCFRVSLQLLIFVKCRKIRIREVDVSVLTVLRIL